MKYAKYLQGGPCLEINETERYPSGFHYSPWCEGTSSRIWHNRSDKLFAAFPLDEKKEKKNQQKRTTLCKWRQGGLIPTLKQAVGCLVCPHPLKVRLLPQKEAGGHTFN